MADPDTNTVIDALKAQSEHLFGCTGAQVEPVAVFDRPYSTVIRLRIVTPESAPSYAFTKVYKVRAAVPYEVWRPAAEVVRDEFAATARLHEALNGRRGLASPRPIASLPQHGAIVTQELPGTPLDRVLRRRGVARRAPTLEAIATRVAAWLRTYQHAGHVEGTWRADACRRYLDDRLTYIARWLGGRPREQALAVFDRIAARLPAALEPLVPIHADLCPANILVTPGGGVGVLDFATAQAGSRYHDLAHLYFHLELVRRRARRRGIAIAPVQDTLVASFDRLDTRRHPLFRAMLLQHAVCHVTQLVDVGPAPGLLRVAFAHWRWRTCLGMTALTDFGAGL